MKRRKVLAMGCTGAVFGIAGCLDYAQVLQQTPSSSEDTSELDLRLKEVNDAPDDYGISLDVTLPSTRSNNDLPPEITIEVENVGEETILLSSWHRFRAGGFQLSEPDGLSTITTDEAEELAINPEQCWLLEGTLTRTMAIRQSRVQPGESESDVRHVITSRMGDSDGEPCPEPGEYTFATTYRVYDQEDERACNGSGLFPQGEKVECSFTLEVA